MKRIIAFLILISLSLSLTACTPQEENFYGEWKTEPYQLSNSNEYYFSSIFLCPNGEYYEMLVELDTNLVEIEFQGEWFLNGNKIVIIGDYHYTMKYRKLSKTLVTPGGMKYKMYDPWPLDSL